MSGHSKWSSIKHKKAAVDAKRGKAFTKLIREITTAAKVGGGNAEGNTRLKTAIQKAREFNMPQDNIQKAIKRGTGELEGVSYEEIVYEGYGPAGVAVIVETLTDNKNRTAAEVRSTFSKNGGNLGENGCVAWMFEKKGLIAVEEDKIEEDKLMEIILDAGAEDLKNIDGVYEILTEVDNFDEVKKAISDNEIEMKVSEISMIPKNTVKIDEKKVNQTIRLLETLEDNDDVQNVYSNVDIPEDILEE